MSLYNSHCPTCGHNGSDWYNIKKFSSFKTMGLDTIECLRCKTEHKVLDVQMRMMSLPKSELERFRRIKSEAYMDRIVYEEVIKDYIESAKALL